MIIKNLLMILIYELSLSNNKLFFEFIKFLYIHNETKNSYIFLVVFIQNCFLLSKS